MTKVLGKQHCVAVRQPERKMTLQISDSETLTTQEKSDTMRDLRFSGKRPQKVRGLRLSTNVLLRSLEFEANWDTLVAMLEELKNRRDVYDVAPLLKLSLEETLPH